TGRRAGASSPSRSTSATSSRRSGHRWAAIGSGPAPQHPAKHHVQGVIARQERQDRPPPPTHAAELPQDPLVVLLDRQALQERGVGLLAALAAEKDAAVVEAQTRIVELERDRLAAQLRPLARAPRLEGEAQPVVGEVAR